MKFTSEDLLKAMGLKVGDRINLGESVFEILNRNKNIICAKCDKEPFMYAISLVELVDRDYTIIQPKPTLTEDEESLAKLLFNQGYKYVFKNMHSFYCCVSERKPIRNVNKWQLQEDLYYSMNMFTNLFQFIKWEDEPYPIEELLKE